MPSSSIYARFYVIYTWKATPLICILEALGGSFDATIHNSYIWHCQIDGFILQDEHSQDGDGGRVYSGLQWAVQLGISLAIS